MKGQNAKEVSLRHLEPNKKESEMKALCCTPVINRNVNMVICQGLTDL